MKNRSRAPKEIPLVAAVLSGDRDKMKVLLQAGESPAQADPLGRTALHHAVLNGRPDLVHDLLAAKANPDQADVRGWTPLHFAAQNQLVDVARALLEHGASVDAVDEHGNTPLFRAVFESRGRGEMITTLRQNGADEHRKNLHGVSPADLAKTIANFDVRRWLE